MLHAIRVRSQFRSAGHFGLWVMTSLFLVAVAGLPDFARADDPDFVQQAYLKASNTGGNDQFGNAVAISGDTLVVAAFREASSTTGVNSTPDDDSSFAGAAYVYARSNGIWQPEAYLKPSNTDDQDRFGLSVAISGNTIVIGAPEEDSGSNGVNSNSNEAASNAGAAYVFRRSGGVWTQEAYLKASNSGANDQFGTSVAISGNVIVVGAPDEDGGSSGVNGPQNDGTSSSGAAYVFRRSSGNWSQEAYLKSTNPNSADDFGYSVAVSGDLIAVGARNEDTSMGGINPSPDNALDLSGAVYTFERVSGQWTTDTFIKASNPDFQDRFGVSVALDGETLVVGANQEDSSTTGVNSSPDELADFAGAAYVFHRNNGSWTQQAYLKPLNTSAGDQFGDTVSISGDLIVIGSANEDSTSTGVNGADNDDFNGSGAAYVFLRSNDMWQQNAYLKASNTGSSDGFGDSVAVSMDTVVVGATTEDSAATGVNGGQLNSNAQNSGAAYVFKDSSILTINTGLSDVWGDPDIDGQGFVFTVFPDARLMFIAWFTYDTERPADDVMAILGDPGHRWLTALGGWDENNKVTLDVQLTTGGRFDRKFPKVDRPPQSGTIMIQFHDCDNATLTYNLPEIGKMGTIELTRIVKENIVLCEALGGFSSE